MGDAWAVVFAEPGAVEPRERVHYNYQSAIRDAQDELEAGRWVRMERRSA